MDKKELVLGIIEDLVTNFMVYDRKEDEELMLGDIEQLIEDEVITAEEICLHFCHCLDVFLKT